MADRDFRYEMPDGSEVEAFQLTEATRFQEKGWPDWMDSRYLMTKESVDGGKKTNWLNINDVETEIPVYGWIVNEGGRIYCVEYEVMEQAEKVVPEVVPIPSKANYLPDDALRLAAKLSKQTFEEVKEADRAQVDRTNALRDEIIRAQGGEPEPDSRVEEIARAREAEILGESEQITVRTVGEPGPAPAVPIPELITVLEVLKNDAPAGIAALKASVSQRVTWCTCPPGQCAGGDQISCRQNSPLTA
jgi:hypothetical protein